MAIPLTAYLSKYGYYEGFDVVPDSIDFCKNHITPSFPNFNFQVADVYNSYYNPQGSQRAESYQFPYPDNSFDLVFSTSVFTHMLPEGIEQYLREIHRVLKLNAYAFNTYYLLNDETVTAIDNRKTKIRFPFNMGNYYSGYKNVAECLVAFNCQDIITFHNRTGLIMEGDIHYGHWRHSATTYPTYYSSQKEYMGYQDLIVARKI